MSDEMPGEAVQVAGPEFSDGVTVCGRTVTLVVGPFIGFILGLRSQFDHEPVSRDFGDSRENLYDILKNMEMFRNQITEKVKYIVTRNKLNT